MNPIDILAEYYGRGSKAFEILVSHGRQVARRALADGIGILLVSTDFEEIASICHRAIVFSQGTIVDELSGSRLTTENLIQSASAGNIASQKEQLHAIA